MELINKVRVAIENISRLIGYVTWRQWPVILVLLTLVGAPRMLDLIEAREEFQEPEDSIQASMVEQLGPLADPTKLAGTIALVALLTSVLLQIRKEQGGLRAIVHKQALYDWLEDRFSINDSSNEKDTPKWVLSKNAMIEVEELCGAGARLPAFYNLSTAQFCGQIGTAVDLVMISPKSYENFFKALTSGGNEAFKTNVDKFLIRDDDFRHSRIDVSHHAQRSLDGLQVEAVQRWKRRLLWEGLVFSGWISLSIAVIVAWPQQLLINEVLRFFYTATVCAVAGALLAPIAYDLTSAIRGLGK